jgi:hypothetical protein
MNRIHVAVCAALMAAACSTTRLPQTQLPTIWVITHMANTEDAVRWGAGTGSNGVEMDLRFDDSGNPSRFEHGFPCDCTCFITYGVCQHLGSSKCTASTAPDTLLKTVAAQPALGMVVIDSKVDQSTNAAAGTNVIRLLDTALFANGFKGVAIVGAPALRDFPYLQAAADAASQSPNAARIYFTIDGEGKDVVPVLMKLTTLSSPNIVYGTGISACAPGDFEKTIALAAKNESAGVIGLAYIWTIDKNSSASSYLKQGANGVMTNAPDTIVPYAKSLGYTLAAPGTLLPPATSKTVITN